MSKNKDATTDLKPSRAKGNNSQLEIPNPVTPSDSDLLDYAQQTMNVVYKMGLSGQDSEHPE